MKLLLRLFVLYKQYDFVDISHRRQSRKLRSSARFSDLLRSKMSKKDVVAFWIICMTIAIQCRLAPNTNTNIIKSSQTGFLDSIYNNIKRNPNCLQDHLKNYIKIKYVDKSRTNLRMILFHFPTLQSTH